jgi:hypothetical protein
MELSGSYPNMSKFVRVKAVNYPTPNYFDANGNPVSAYTASIPINGSGSFSTATGDIKAGTGATMYAISTTTQGLLGVATIT